MTTILSILLIIAALLVAAIIVVIVLLVVVGRLATRSVAHSRQAQHNIQEAMSLVQVVSSVAAALGIAKRLLRRSAKGGK